jgi:hypothetical protein
MRMRSSLLAVMMVSGLAAGQARHLCVTAVGRSAHAFYEYFQVLQQEPMNPVERVVFSFALAKVKVQQSCTRPPMHG